MNKQIPVDIWHDDEGVWLQIKAQVYGPFTTEAEAEQAHTGIAKAERR